MQATQAGLNLVGLDWIEGGRQIEVRPPPPSLPLIANRGGCLQAMQMALRLVREAAGDAYLMGCRSLRVAPSRQTKTFTVRVSSKWALHPCEAEHACKIARQSFPVE